jgi:hypothetical protein
MHSNEGICMHLKEFHHLLVVSIQQMKEEYVQYLLLFAQRRKRHEIRSGKFS